MTMENPPLENVFPIEHWDFPISCVFLRGLNTFTLRKQAKPQKVRLEDILANRLANLLKAKFSMANLACSFAEFSVVLLGGSSQSESG